MLEYYKFKKVHELFIKSREKEALDLLAELQKRYIALCDQNTNQKIQIQEYEDILYLARNLVFDGQYYWLITGSVKQGPFCPICYNMDGMLVRLGGEIQPRHCQQCNTEFHKPNEHPSIATGSLAAEVYEAMPAETRRAKVLPFVR